ncbi:MAG: hypothetical protein JSW42_06600, partial [Chloroflexota bacterium]
MMSKDIYVVIEHIRGEIADISYMMLAGAHQLAEVTGGEVVALLLGSNIENLAENLAADKVLYFDHEQFADFTSDSYWQSLSIVIEESAPRAVIFGHTSIGMEVA